MRSDAVRTGFLLLLTAVGFLAAYLSTGNSYYIPLGCWALALVYALATNPRRWL